MSTIAQTEPPPLKNISTIREHCHHSPPRVRVFLFFVSRLKTLPLGEVERYYGKDAPVPPPWAEWLTRAIPEPMQALGSGDIMSYLKPLVLCSHSTGASVFDVPAGSTRNIDVLLRHWGHIHPHA